MIQKILISKIATFGNDIQQMSGLKSINFIYGSNGSGKTTISRIIRNIEDSVDYQLVWKYNPLKKLVYNKDFIEENFNQRSGLKGIFTLGSDSKEIMDEIEGKLKEREKLIDDINSIKNTLNTIIEEEILSENSFKEACWIQKQKYDLEFQKAFIGYRGDSNKFKEKCKEEFDNTTELLSLEELKKKAEVIFNDAIDEIDTVQNIEFSELINIESNDIFKTKMIGKEDVDLSALIEKLKNIDWVNRGRDYLEKSKDQCPFCQQHIQNDLKAQLDEFFDESYRSQINTLSFISNQYQVLFNAKIELCKAISDSENKYIIKENIDDLITIIESKYRANLILIENKLNEPSKPISLVSVDEEFQKVSRLIDEVNVETRKYNARVVNINLEKEILIKQVWRYIIEELKHNISNYVTLKKKNDKTKQGINENLNSKNARLKNVIIKISELENKIISVKPTIDKINLLLSEFGFTSFKLDEDSNQVGNYIIIRNNNDKVGGTLSEGEKTFISFLYFYHLLKGSNDSSQITENRIVVFDDPISSLDSDVLFIVSNLIRRIISEMRDDKYESNIKQLFVFTHNTYFYKEVTFNKGKGSNKLKDETFWIIRKENEESIITQYDSNPVKTSYELLWNELKEKKNINSSTIHNTMRRILENYFKIQGNKNWENVITMFAESEQIICNSLITWLHDGSHSINEDLFVNTNPESITRYLVVFKGIFDKTGHESHYNMMMGIGESVEEKSV